MEWSGAPYGPVGQVTDDSRELHEELQRAVFPRYQVGEEIGRGGMSIVFRAWDTVELHPVAIKVLKHQYSTVLGPTRFLREIRLQTELKHPGILPLLDSGRSDSLLYYTMPLVEGETLQARLRAGAAATARHRPADPLPGGCGARLRAREGGRPPGHKAQQPFRDCGIGRWWPTSVSRRTSRRRSTRADKHGLVLGTALYMSPEQADGNHLADRRADVYSLGCVAYQMIAGEPPFTGPSTQAVIARHRTMPAPSVRVVRPDLPRGVDAVLRKALAKSPADRYPRAGEFASTLCDPVKLAAAAKEAEADAAPAPRRWVVPLLLLRLSRQPSSCCCRTARWTRTRWSCFRSVRHPPRRPRREPGSRWL